MHDINDVVDPYARQLGFDQLATVLENIPEMKLGAVILAHGSRKASACHRRRTAGGAALCDLDNGNVSVYTLKRGHCAGCSAADDQHVSLMTPDGYLRTIGVGTTCHCL